MSDLPPAAALPPPAYVTQVRNSRRHSGDEAEIVEEDVRSRRLQWLALALGTLVLAAGVGVGVGLLTTPAAPPAATHTTTTPQQALATAARPILAKLANAQHAELAKLARARTSRAQAGDAAAIERDFRTARTALSALPAADRRLSSARTLDTAVSTLTKDWATAAAAARAGDVKRYDATRAAITRESARLVSAATVADRG